jgi:hypothetical protein
MFIACQVSVYFDTERANDLSNIFLEGIQIDENIGAFAQFVVFL